MTCYNCGTVLCEQDFCTNCGADVSLYKKILMLANRCYNDGLERAEARDLSGAKDSLRQSLSYNKYQTEARNLLGLIYYEMGEIVSALNEWVISLNLQPEQNIAQSLIDRVRASGAKMDAMMQSVSKYNKALDFCYQDSRDLAVIQLKQALSLNSNLLVAHQLLALLYISSSSWDKASRELQRAKRIDVGNARTLRYIREVETHTLPDAAGGKKRSKDGVTRFTSDNELIIQPNDYKAPKRGNFGMLLNVAIGLVIGVAATFFLAVPAAVRSDVAPVEQQVVQLSEQLDTKTAEIVSLQSDLGKLRDENTDLQSQMGTFAGTDARSEAYQALIQAASVYIDTKDASMTDEALSAIPAGIDLGDEQGPAAQLLAKLEQLIGPDVAGSYLERGQTLIEAEAYDDAVNLLQRAVAYDSTNGEALFALGDAYRLMGKAEEAIDAYTKVIDIEPGTYRATRSQNFIDELNGN